MSDQHRHQLEIRGYNELLAEHCELVDGVSGLTGRIAAVEKLLADLRLPELVRELEALGCTVTLRIEPTPQAPAEVVADTGRRLADCAQRRLRLAMRRTAITIHNAMLPEHYEQMQAELAELAGSLTALDAALGAYYTPPAVLALVDPASGSGSYLVEIVKNPPYAR